MLRKTKPGVQVLHKRANITHARGQFVAKKAFHFALKCCIGIFKSKKIF